MAYITREDYTDRFGTTELQQLLQLGGLTLESAVDDATETVDSYLAAIPGRAFTLPLIVPPAKVKGVTADIARYELWAQRASEEVQRRYDQAIAYLKDLVAGRAVLIVEAETPADEIGNPIQRVGYRSARRVFTDCTLDEFVGPAHGREADWRRD